MTKLDLLTTKLGAHYFDWKRNEKAIQKGVYGEEGLRTQFFNAITELQDTLAQRVVTIRDVAHEEYAVQRAEKYNPRWQVLSVTPVGDHKSAPLAYDVLLEERPELIDYVYVNQKDKTVYRRQVVDGSPEIDDERLREEDPDLWNEITDFKDYEFIADLLEGCGLGAVDINDKILVHSTLFGWPERIVRPLDELDAESYAKLQEYVHPGTPTVKLAAPRAAKPEELNDG